MNSSSGASGRGGFNERDLWGCELQADLPGFQSDMVPLSNIHYMDNPDIGTIILHRLGKGGRPNHQRGLRARPERRPQGVRKGARAPPAKTTGTKPKKNFEKAVEHLSANIPSPGSNLGRLQEENGQSNRRRPQSLPASHRRPNPSTFCRYEQPLLARLARTKWQELVDLTDQWLRLDSAQLPRRLLPEQHRQSADPAHRRRGKNARESIRLDPAKKNMRDPLHSGLGPGAETGLRGAAAAIREYLATANPDAKDNCSHPQTTRANRRRRQATNRRSQAAITRQAKLEP